MLDLAALIKIARAGRFRAFGRRQSIRVITETAGQEVAEHANLPRLFRFEGFRHEADTKDGFPGFVQEFHLPLRVFRKMACDRADHAGANGGQLFPGGILIG